MSVEPITCPGCDSSNIVRNSNHNGKQNLTCQDCGRQFVAKYHIYTGESLNWLQVLLRLERSAIPVILPWVLFCTGYGFFVSLLHYLGLPIAFPQMSRVLTNAVLSFNIGLTLLLVFRTNTAHERFWEGRRLWGALVNAVRNLTRGIWIVIKERSPQDRAEKEVTLRLVVAFAVAMKLHLRREPVNNDLSSLLSPSQYAKLKEMNHPPLEIAFWIGDYLQYQHDRRCLNIYQLTALHKLLDEIVNILGGCERILKTPMPLAYASKFKQLLLIYCLILPLELVSTMNWWTAPLMAFVSFTLFGIEQIGAEIEEPFGYDPNDLPLDVICNTMRRNVEDLIKLAPTSAGSWRVETVDN